MVAFQPVNSVRQYGTPVLSEPIKSDRLEVGQSGARQFTEKWSADCDREDHSDGQEHQGGPIAVGNTKAVHGCVRSKPKNDERPSQRHAEENDGADNGAANGVLADGSIGRLGPQVRAKKAPLRVRGEAGG